MCITSVHIAWTSPCMTTYWFSLWSKGTSSTFADEFGGTQCSPRTLAMYYIIYYFSWDMWSFVKSKKGSQETLNDLNFMTSFYLLRRKKKKQSPDCLHEPSTLTPLVFTRVYVFVDLHSENVMVIPCPSWDPSTALCRGCLTSSCERGEPVLATYLLSGQGVSPQNGSASALLPHWGLADDPQDCYNGREHWTFVFVLFCFSLEWFSRDCLMSCGWLDAGS